MIKWIDADLKRLRNGKEKFYERFSWTDQVYMSLLLSFFKVIT